MTQLRIEALAVERGGRPVVRGVSVVLSAGQYLAVTGRNGAGKSTLLRAIAGLLPPAAGSIEWSPPTAPIGENTHYLGHLDGLKAGLTVIRNLRLWSMVAGAAGLAPIEALERVGLDQLADFPAGYLSAGQRRRVALARLLLVRRPLWLLDEPTASLDAEAEAGFAALLGGHLEAGGLAVVATHRPLPIAPAATLALGGS